MPVLYAAEKELPTWDKLAGELVYLGLEPSFAGRDVRLAKEIIEVAYESTFAFFQQFSRFHRAVSLACELRFSSWSKANY